MTFDPAVLDDVLDLDGPARVAVASTIAARPQVHLVTAGASTFTVLCDDVDNEIPAKAAGLTATTAGRTWLLVAIRRVNGRTKLVFHDDVVVTLTRDVGLFSVPAGSTTINELATRLTRPLGVDLLLEPTRLTLAREFVRDTSTWAGLDVIAESSGRWRYSDGQQLVLASPAWLLTQGIVETVVDGDDQVGNIDYDLHANKPFETAAATVVRNDAPPVGAVHTLDIPGPAAGEWLVSEWDARLGEDHGRITWTRPKETPWS